MVRAVAGVIVGYIAMFAAVFTSLTGLYVFLGADRAFQPDSWQPSSTWLISYVVLGLIAGVIGGIVCALVAKPGSKAPFGLAALVLVLGLALAGTAIGTSAPEDKPERTSDVTSMQAMQNAEGPMWMRWLDPVIGVAGVLIGGGLVGKRKPE